MDFISHGLWAGIASGRKNKRDYFMVEFIIYGMIGYSPFIILMTGIFI